MKLTRLIISLFALMLLLLPMSVVAENIGVDPTSWDYGEVQVGDVETAVFTISSLGPYDMIVDDIAIRYDVTGSFEITSITSNGEVIIDPFFEIVVGDQAEIEVIFMPQIEGMATAQLYVSSDAANYPTLYIPLQGEGIDSGSDPEEMMDALLEFFDDSVAAGDIVGVGKSQGARNAHLRIVRNMLDSALNYIVAEDYADACEALTNAAVRTDGSKPPPDFVVGDGVSTLNTKIIAVMTALGC